jgi:uncharacterized protein YcbK (DUF882 family)
MGGRRTTIMILAPGRNAIHLDVPVPSPLRAVTLAMLLPLFAGVTAQRFLGDGAGRSYSTIAMGSLHRAEPPLLRHLQHDEPPQLRAATTPSTLPVLAHVPAKAPAGPPLPPNAKPSFGQTTLRALMTAVRPAETPLKAAGLVAPLSAAGLGAVGNGPFAAIGSPDVISVKAILKAISTRRRSIGELEPGVVPINGVLRIQALHFDETLSTRPFDDLLRPDPRAFEDVNHLMRCRVTGHEVQMDPRLIAILSQLSTVYGRTLQLISGHRAPHANGTSPTSQHTLGRAADIRIPGVSITELKKVAIKLGARGVGLYPEKGFVHVDVREKQRYYWLWTARGGEQADMGWSRPKPVHNAEAESSPDEGGEESDQGATAGDVEAHDESHEASAVNEVAPHELPQPTAAEPALAPAQ